MPSPASPQPPRLPHRDLSLLPVAALATAVELWLRRAELNAWAPAMWLTFTLSTLASLLIGSGLVRWLRPIRRRSAPLAALLIAAITLTWCWVVVLSLGYFVQMGSLPVTSAVRYFIEEPRSTLSLIEPYLKDPIVMVAMLAGPIAIGRLWWWAAADITPHATTATRPQNQPRSRLRRVGRALAIPTLAAGLIVGLSLKPPRYRFAVADVHALLLGSNMARLAAKGQAQRLSTPHRVHLPALPQPAGRPNVLLIVNETLGASALSLYNGEAPTTPQTEAFIRQHADRTTVSPAAQSNAGSTLVSLPSLFSGLAPTCTAIEQHTAPLLWDIAKAAGYRTFFFTAQDLNWLQLDLFLLATGLDAHFHAGESDLPRVNDIGVADEQMIAKVMAHLDLLAQDRSRPFLGVVQFNATHMPNAHHPGHAHHYERMAPHQIGKHLDTIAFIDELTGKLLGHLAQLQLLDTTIVGVTADHGHNLKPARMPVRLHNYYESVARVPFWLTLPKRPLNPHAHANLQRNRARRVANIDMTPTLVDAMGVYDALPASARSHMDGQSLLRPLAKGRLLPFVNNTEIRQASRRGFSLVMDDNKFMFYEGQTGCEEHLYNRRADPAERDDRWPTASVAEKRRWYRRVARYPLLMRARVQGPCPPPDPTLLPAALRARNP